MFWIGSCMVVEGKNFIFRRAGEERVMAGLSMGGKLIFFAPHPGRHLCAAGFARVFARTILWRVFRWARS